MKKRIILSLLFLALMTGAAQAYIVTFDAPAELQAGAPIEVTGSTTFAVGTQFDLILYKTQFSTPEIIDRRMIVVDESKTFDASFSTTSLPAGMYKIEVHFLKDPGSSLGSSSVTVREVRLIDRSSEIVLTVPKEQDLKDALVIEGYIPNIGVATITLNIDGPKGYSLPNQNIRTTTTLGSKDGHFSKKVNVTDPGNYYVNVYDAKGFISQLRYSVSASPSVTATAIETSVPEGTTQAPGPGLSVPVAGMLAGLVAAAALVARKRR